MMKITYSFKDFKDKTPEGIIRELEVGLGIAATYFKQTHGLPFEMFQQKINEKDILEQLRWYLNFRNQNPNIYE